MPNVIIKLPEGVFDGEGRAKIARGVTAAAKVVEQFGDAPAQEFLTWIVIEEVKNGCFFAGGLDPTANVIPVMVMFSPPAGVIEADSRAQLVKLIQDAIASAKSSSDSRPVITSVMITDVDDGHWGARGAIWRLPDLARAAGYKHLQHLVA
jgi:phenylpyruvate tautomerase PptA (4-oxalocrotonate tautomerase family)